MEYIPIITNILLAILTALYVVLTYRLVNETKRANEQTRLLFEKQFLLSTLPHIHINLTCDESNININIYNSGEIAAYDVDILAVGVYSDEDIDIPTFMVKYVKPEDRKIELKSTNEGFFGVYDRICYFIFPQNRKVSARLDFPLRPGGVYCLLQFRELSGTNYSQVYWFYERNNETGHSYALGSIEPKIIMPSTYIEMDFNERRNLLAENNQPLPEFVNEFAAHWESSISSGYTKNSSHEIEDRGIWSDI